MLRAVARAGAARRPTTPTTVAVGVDHDEFTRITPRAVVAGRAAVVVAVAPEPGIEHDAVIGHELGGVGNELARLTHPIGAVVQVVAECLVAPAHVVGGVQDQLVPAHIDDLGRTETRAGVGSDGVQVLQRVIEDGLSHLRRHAVLGFQAVDDLCMEVHVQTDDVELHD